MLLYIISFPIYVIYRPWLIIYDTFAYCTHNIMYIAVYRREWIRWKFIGYTNREITVFAGRRVRCTKYITRRYYTIFLVKCVQDLNTLSCRYNILVCRYIQLQLNNESVTSVVYVQLACIAVLPTSSADEQNNLFI